MSRQGQTLLHGVLAAVLTPFHDDLSVDHRALAEHCLRLLDSGCDGLLVQGTTGEAASLTVEERLELLDELTRAGVPMERILVGTGCCAVPDTVRLSLQTAERGAAGVVVLPPYYYKGVSEEGVFRVFEQLARALEDSRLPICLYHFPRLSGVPFTRPLVERLRTAFPEAIAGLKDSSGSWESVHAFTEGFPGLRVYPGSERHLLDSLRIGGAGCISATVNVTSRLAGRVRDNWGARRREMTAFPVIGGTAAGDRLPGEGSAGGSGAREDLDALQRRLTAVREAIEERPLVAALKHLMARSTGRAEWRNIRPPLVPLAAAEAAALERELDALGFSPGEA